MAKKKIKPFKVTPCFAEEVTNERIMAGDHIAVKVTKDHYRRAIMCGTEGKESGQFVTENCAIAVAVREIFPKAQVFVQNYYPFGEEAKLELSHTGQDLVRKFDELALHPERRLDLPEREIHLEVNDALLNKLVETVSNWKEVIEATPHLELIEKK